MRTILWSVLLCAAFAPNAIAQQEISAGSHGYRTFAVTVPFTFTRDSVLHFDVNLGAHAALGLEATYMRRGEEIGEETQAETNESLLTDGMGATLLLSRFSNGPTLSGFYYSLGLGYRQQTAQWAVEPDANDPDVDLALVDDEDRLNHDAVMKGPTAHIRIGYRYVGDEIPFSFGFYVGVRHFQSAVEDRDVQSDDPRRRADVPYATMTEKEKDGLKKRFATSPEPGLELGWAF